MTTMAVPANYLQQVQTFQMSGLALLQNYSCFISTANTKFREFNKMTANLGDTVTFNRPSRFVYQPSLNVTFQPATQLVQPLTVNQQGNASYVFTSQQLIFNVEDYLKEFARDSVAEVSTQVEAYVAGLAETQPYRFYGDGVTQINSFGQLASMMAQFRTFGAAKGDAKAYLADTAVPTIVNSGLNQFVQDRNEDMAMSWMVGNFRRTDWYESNLLPIHTSGNVGNNGTTLTVVSVNDPTGANVTQITFSGATDNDASAILAYDSFQFNDNVSGQPNMRFLTYVGHLPSAAPVQFQATAQAGANGSGDVTVNITPALCWQSGNPNQNISTLTPIAAGMTCSVLPSHRCGLVVGGNALYLAMPQLPDMYPYPTGNSVDETTGVSMRLYYGGIVPTGQVGYIHDVIFGATAVPDYLMKIAFPL
jgi:P22 coat protein - gene protein 5